MNDKLTTEQMIYDKVCVLEKDIKNILNRLPVVETQSKNEAKKTSIITSSAISFFLGPVLTLLTLLMIRAIDKK